MTYNPSTDSETYISAAFHLHRFDHDEEVISIMQNKRGRAPTPGGTPEVVELTERGPGRTSADALNPGYSNQHTSSIFKIVPFSYYIPNGS